MQLDNLKYKVQENFFAITGPILRSDLTKAVSFLSIRVAFQRQESEWEIVFTTCAEELDGLEFRVNMLLHVTMEEVHPIVSRFIKQDTAQRDKDAPPQR
jgi:hypothetical protein